MTHLVTRSQLVRVTSFIHHRPKPLFKTAIASFQTLYLPKFSTKTAVTARRRAHPLLRPAMDAQSPESAAPEDFVHVADLKMESLSDSMVRIDEPSVADAVSSAPEETPADSDRRPMTLPAELSRNVVVLSCESSAEGGVCDVYLVGTAHVSEVCVRN